MTDYSALDAWKEQAKQMFSPHNRIHLYIGGEQMRTSMCFPYWPPLVNLLHRFKASWWREKELWVVGWVNLPGFIKAVYDGEFLLQNPAVLHFPLGAISFNGTVDGMNLFRGRGINPALIQLFGFPTSTYGEHTIHVWPNIQYDEQHLSIVQRMMTGSMGEIHLSGDPDLIRRLTPRLDSEVRGCIGYGDTTWIPSALNPASRTTTIEQPDSPAPVVRPETIINRKMRQ